MAQKYMGLVTLPFHFWGLDTFFLFSLFFNTMEALTWHKDPWDKARFRSPTPIKYTLSEWISPLILVLHVR